MSNLHRKIPMITIRKVCVPKEDCDDQPKPQELENHHLSVSPIKIIMICTLAATLAFICYITIIKTCRALKTRRRRRVIRSQIHGMNTDHQTHQDHFIDEEHEPVVFHPIWLINTVGLDQSVIDSIEMFKYRKEDGLIDGTTGSDCAVCLGSFQEEESLRLLPKCSHAFHVTCIDTWLRSHKNCPLCRAPIVNNSTSNQPIDQNFVESSAAHEEINEIIGVETGQEIDSNGESSCSEKTTSFTSVVRVLQNDLTDHFNPRNEPIKRSVSLGSFDQEGGELPVLSKKPNMVPKSAKPIRSSSSISMYNRVAKSSSFGPKMDLEEI